MTVLLNELAAAEVLNLKPTTLRRWRWAGKGPAYHRIGGGGRGGAVRYHPDDLQTFLAAGRVVQNG